ncbi:membrane-anchored junction protein isoform X1 [Cottoperca gobio]|uniref:Membrane-anchored junction protein isoform X1 n=1 Tax=Cottoperca gobio TaxID=56716 RepID=A0A6J2RL07_COTGO|nr:membrane-anchored junction protein isoform X1 [Cottoperca gobio]
MPLQAFSFTFPETRFFKAGRLVYKFKIRGGCSFRGEEVMEGNGFTQELEEIIRTVLGNLDRLHPFSSVHFNVFPYKKRWDGASELMCKYGERKLTAYPFSLTLYLEKNMPHEETKRAEQKLSPEKDIAHKLRSVSEPRSKRSRRSSPLEEAKLKDVFKDSETSVVGLSLDCAHARREVREDAGCADEEDEAQQKAGVNTVKGSGTPGEVHPGTMQPVGEEEAECADSVPGTPVRPWVLTRLASRVFPFSLLFRDT